MPVWITSNKNQHISVRLQHACPRETNTVTTTGWYSGTEDDNRAIEYL